MVCFTLCLCISLLFVYFMPTVQHFVKPPSSCVAAEICNHTGISVCGLDKHTSSYRHFLDECDMFEYNCDNKREYTTSNMKNCQQNTKPTTRNIQQSTTTTTSNLENSANSLEGISRTENAESSVSNSLTNNETTQTISTPPTTSAQHECTCKGHRNIFHPTEFLSSIFPNITCTANMSKEISLSTQPIEKVATITLSTAVSGITNTTVLSTDTSPHSTHISQSTEMNSSQIGITTIKVTPNIHNKCTCDAVQESNTQESTKMLTTPMTTTSTETTTTVITTENSSPSSLKTDSSVSITTPYFGNKCTCGLKDIDVHSPTGTTETSTSVKTTITEISQVTETSTASLTTVTYQTTELSTSTSKTTSQITEASTEPMKSTDMQFTTNNTSTEVPNIENPCTCSANTIDSTTKKIDTTTTIAPTTTTSSTAYTTMSEHLTSAKVSTNAINSVGHCTCGLLTTEKSISTLTSTESTKTISPSSDIDKDIEGEFENTIPESDGSSQKENTSNLFIDSTSTATQNIQNHCTCGANTPRKKTETTTIPTVPTTKTYLTTITTAIHTTEQQTKISTTPSITERHCTCGLSTDKPKLTTASSNGNEDTHQTVTKTKKAGCGKYPDDCDRPHTWETTAKGETRDFFQILKARYGTRVRFLRATTHYPYRRDKPIVNNDVSIFMFGQHNDA